MKGLTNNILKLCALSLVLFMTSCGDDEETFDIPTISVTMSDADGNVIPEGGVVVSGDEVKMTVSISAAGGFNVYNFTDGVTSVSVSRTDLGVDAGTVSVNDAIVITVSGDVGAEISIDFVAVDDLDQSSNTFTVTLTISSPPVAAYAAFMLAAPLGDLSGASFFSTNTGTIYDPATVNASELPLSNDIDFGYYYGETNMASIASPEGFSTTVFSGQVEAWGTKNSTTLKATSMDASAFNEINTAAEVETAYAAGTDGSEFKTGLAVGDVLAFETNSTKTNSPSKKGLILVTKITGTTGSTDGIEIEVLVQQ